MAMCMKCTTKTKFVLCDRCYFMEQAYIKAIDRALAAGVPIDSGTIRNGERSRRWCEEREARLAEVEQWAATETR